MPSLSELNQPPHPLWDFIASLENHPLFSGPQVPPGQDQQPREGTGPGLGGPFGGWGGPFSPHRGPGSGSGPGCGRGHQHQPYPQTPDQALPNGPNLATFIQTLASNLGLDQILPHLQHQHRPSQPHGRDQVTPDFTPPIDIISTPAQILVHVSLPGAKKDDLSVEYDVASSALRVAGVVYRPGVDEVLHSGLAVREREKEVGVFERVVRLGTGPEEAGVRDAGGIAARLEDGVLRVVVPRDGGGKMGEMGRNVVVEGEEDCEGGDGGDGGDGDGLEEYVRVGVQ
jgi:HSP20 family protein